MQITETNTWHNGQLNSAVANDLRESERCWTEQVTNISGLITLFTVSMGGIQLNLNIKTDNFPTKTY